MTLLLTILICVLSLTAFAQEANETTNVSGVLGRTFPLRDLWDDFEETKWCYDCGGLWRSGSGDGVPEILKRVPTPVGGKEGSKGSLEIRTNKIDRDQSPSMEKLLTAEFKDKLKRKLKRVHKPVFIVRVWLPPFNQWGDHYTFGFRHESFLENGSKDQNYSSLFLVYNRQYKTPFFRYRVGTNKLCYEVHDPRPIEQDGWWTLVNARKIYPGIGAPSNKGEIAGITTITSLLTKYGKDALLIDYFNYSFFHLDYPISGNTSPRFVIDDYEVWVDKDVKKVEK